MENNNNNSITIYFYEYLSGNLEQLCVTNFSKRERTNEMAGFLQKFSIKARADLKFFHFSPELDQEKKLKYSAAI